MLNKRFKNRSSLILERLDRIIATNDWLFTYPNDHVLHLPRIHSDHYPLLLTVYADDPIMRKKLFRIEKMWERHSNFANVIKHVGGNNPLLEKVVNFFVHEVFAWACTRVGNIFKRKVKLLRRIQGIQKFDTTTTTRSLGS